MVLALFRFSNCRISLFVYLNLLLFAIMENQILDKNSSRFTPESDHVSELSLLPISILIKLLLVRQDFCLEMAIFKKVFLFVTIFVRTVDIKRC